MPRDMTGASRARRPARRPARSLERRVARLRERPRVRPRRRRRVDASASLILVHPRPFVERSPVSRRFYSVRRSFDRRRVSLSDHRSVSLTTAPPSLPLRHGPVPADAKVRAVLLLHLLPPRRPRAAGAHHGGAFYLTLVPIRPRSRGERRSLRTFPGASLRPGSLGFNTRPQRLSTPLLTPFNSTPTFA